MRAAQLKESHLSVSGNVTDPREDNSAPTTVEVFPGVPAWTDQVADRLVSLLHLPRGWDSLEAPPPRLATAMAALDLLLQLTGRRTCAPEIVPTVSGGVQLEWHQGEIDLEIEVLSPYRFDVYFEDLQTGEVWEEESVVDLTQLRSKVARLSR